MELLKSEYEESQTIAVQNLHRGVEHLVTSYLSVLDSEESTCKSAMFDLSCGLSLGVSLVRINKLFIVVLRLKTI